MPAIAPIPGEHFVAAIPRQGYGDVLARHGADLESRHRRTVAKRLVIDRRQAVEQIEGIRIDISDVMIGVVALGNFGGIGGFVPASRPECDREGADRVRRQTRHHRHDAARIDAAREKGAERYVGDHPHPD